MLADEIATLARRLATDTIPHDYILTVQGVSQLLKQSDWAQIQEFK